MNTGRPLRHDRKTKTSHGKSLNRKGRCPSQSGANRSILKSLTRTPDFGHNDGRNMRHHQPGCPEMTLAQSHLHTRFATAAGESLASWEQIDRQRKQNDRPRAPWHSPVGLVASKSRWFGEVSHSSPWKYRPVSTMEQVPPSNQQPQTRKKCTHQSPNHQKHEHSTTIVRQPGRGFEDCRCAGAMSDSVCASTAVAGRNAPRCSVGRIAPSGAMVLVHHEPRPCPTIPTFYAVEPG